MTVSATTSPQARPVTTTPANWSALAPHKFLERASLVHAKKTAVVDGDRSFTYAEWYDRALKFARMLSVRGVGPGKRVAVLALNSEPLLLAHHAVPISGGELVAINTRLGVDEVAYILEHCDAAVIVVSEELVDRIVPDRLAGCLVLDDAFEEELNASTPLKDAGYVWDELSTISINYTSGTTGKPKGVMYHHRGAYLNALAMALEHGLTSDSTYLWTLPMFHCNGWCFPWATAATGANNICLPSVDVEKIWELCLAGKVTHLSAAPTVLTRLLESPSVRNLSSPVRIITAGAAPSPTVMVRMRELGFRVDHVYGLTETYGPFTTNPDSGSVDDPDCKLLPRQGLPNVVAGEVKVVTANNQAVPADGVTLGEVLMRGNVVMTGYLNSPDATAEAMQDGWFHSGDLAVVHPNQQIEIRDRIKDLVISGGENISTVEVEQAIASHPGVVECAVVGRLDAQWGEVPVAFVSVRDGSTVTEADILDHCRSLIARYKCPKDIFFGELPKSSTGKIVKTQLKERL